jgi:hypothetical protein
LPLLRTALEELEGYITYPKGAVSMFCSFLSFTFKIPSDMQGTRFMNLPSDSCIRGLVINDIRIALLFIVIALNFI